jgi:hypothetical protein
MYFPYLRGRQYELLALRELAEGNLLGSHVIPVIEPIKISPTFMTTMEAFTRTEQPVGLVFNPEIGDLSGKNQLATNELRTFLENQGIIPAVIINKKSPECLRGLATIRAIDENIMALLKNPDCLDVYETEFSAAIPRFTLFSDDRRFRRTVKNNKVLFEDKFNKQQRNADYPQDEFFSEDHLFYVGEGYQGFGDYSIVGDEFTESAFAPYAVAIHIVYFDQDKALRVRHFVSDSNVDISDVAGKFSEAVEKLATWYKNIEPKPVTKGLQTLLRHHENGTYPGLPTLKKLSITHHLELVGKFLDGVKTR